LTEGKQGRNNLMPPEVTVGICARNSEKTIGEAINSVAKQDFPHELMEIIFVDDGSKDKTLQIMQRFASKTDIATKIISQSWSGVGKARNKILQEAAGNFILWVDSDETLEKDYLKKQMHLMRRDSKAGILIGQIGISNGANPVLALELIPLIVEYSHQEWTDPAKLPGAGGTIYRVKAARQAGGFDEKITGRGEDIELTNRIKQSGWKILKGDAKFFETHGQLSSWKKLWKRYLYEGTQVRRHYWKTNQYYSLYRINPLASFIASLSYAFRGYRETKLKTSVFLPIHFTFKMTAWFYGFSKGQ
jgi:glycosyltransferase involved in cell wall biosynthesis